MREFRTKKKVSFLVALMLMTSIMLLGCSAKEDESQTNIAIAKNGKVTETIVENFSEDYYSVDELNDMILAEISGFNAENGEGSMNLEKAEKVDSNVKVVLSYNTSNIFSKFNNIQFFIGNGADAQTMGYSLDVVLNDIKDATKTFGSVELKGVTKNQILITDTDELIYLPAKALYVSDNCQVLDNQSAVKRKPETTGCIYVVFK